MRHLISLPRELLDLIAEYIDYASDLNALSQTCRGLHDVATSRLYPELAKDSLALGLVRIAKNGNADSVRKLIAAGVISKEMRYAEGLDPTTLAAERGHVEVIKVLVESFGVSYLKEGDQNIHPQRKASGIAAVGGHVNVLQYLLDAGVSLKRSYDDERMDCLNQAVLKSPVSSLRFLVEQAQCDVNESDKRKTTPLYWASLSGNLGAVKYLVEAGANPKVISSCERPLTPLCCAAIKAHPSVVEYLLQVGAHEAYGPHSRLGLVASSSRISTVKRILDCINWEEFLGNKALHGEYMFCAAASGNEILIRQLLFMGCDAVREFQRQEDTYCSPLVIAAFHGHVEVTKTLLGEYEKARPEVRKRAFESALSHAIYQKHIPVIKAILDHDGEKIIEEYGCQALLISMLDKVMSEELCRRGALDQINHSATKAFLITYGLLWENLAVVEQLLDRDQIDIFDAMYHLPFDDGFVLESPEHVCSILDTAAIFGTLQGFKIILARGPPLNSDDYRHRATLMCAAINLQPEIIELFLDSGFDVNGRYGMFDLDGLYKDHDLGELAQMSLLMAVVSNMCVGPGREIAFPPTHQYTTGAFVQSTDFPQCFAHIDSDLVDVTKFPRVVGRLTFSRKLQTIHMLIDRGADPNATEPKGMTALRYLTMEPPLDQGNIVVVKELLSRGANPLVDFEGKNALKAAVYYGHVVVVEMYLDAIIENGYHHPDLLDWILEILNREDLGADQQASQNQDGDEADGFDNESQHDFQELVNDQVDHSEDGLPDNAVEDPNRAGENQDADLQTVLNENEGWAQGLPPLSEPVNDYGPFNAEETEENIRLRIPQGEEWQTFSTRKALDRFYWRVKHSTVPCLN